MIIIIQLLYTYHFVKYLLIIPIVILIRHGTNLIAKLCRIIF